jgi:hypothetical protein
MASAQSRADCAAWREWGGDMTVPARAVFVGRIARVQGVVVMSVRRAVVRRCARMLSASFVVVLVASGLVVATTSVAAAAMSAQGVNFNMQEFLTSAATIGTFTDTTPSPASGYTVSVDWGDGNTTAGSVASNPDGSFSVTGNAAHTYTADGTYTVTFTVSETGDDHDTATASAVGTVVEANRGIVPGFPTAPENEGLFSGTVETFVDGSATDPPSNFIATINWGDGTSSTGIVTSAGGPGQYAVSGTHTYADEVSGAFSVNLLETDGGGAFDGMTYFINIGDADALTATGASFNATAGTRFTAPVATLTDTNSAAVASDFATTINWGDGTTTAGTVTGPTGGPFTVTGSHTYKPAGSFHVSVTATDDGQGTATTTATATATVTHGHKGH